MDCFPSTRSIKQVLHFLPVAQINFVKCQWLFCDPGYPVDNRPKTAVFPEVNILFNTPFKALANGKHRFLMKERRNEPAHNSCSW